MAETESEPYDPYEQREVKNAITNAEAFISVIKCAVGTGALAMPMAFYNAGYVAGLIGTVVITFIILYALHILIHGMYEVEKQNKVPVLTYSESMELAVQRGPPTTKFLSKFYRYLVDFFLASYHFGIMCVYVVFIALSCKQVADIYAEPLDVRIYMLMFTTPFVFMFMLRDLKHLVPFSLAANILLLIGFCFVFYEIFRNLPSFQERKAFQAIEKFPLFFGTVLFSLESVGVIIAIESEMKTPKDYLGVCGILNKGMIVVVALYAAIGFFGYWRYGELTQGSITLNFGETETIMHVVKIIFANAIYMTYGLQGYVAIKVVFHHFIQPFVIPDNQYTVELITRALIVIFSVLCAIGLPRLDLFLSLVGSFCLSLLGITFPGVLDLCIKYHTGYGKFYFYSIRDIFLILFGLSGCIIGTVTCINDIIEAYTEEEPSTI